MLWDAEVKGLRLRVTAGRGQAPSSWTISRRRDGERRITIGALAGPEVAAARQDAKDMKREVDLRHDPMGERSGASARPQTVQEMLGAYAREHLPNEAPSRSQAPTSAVMWRKIIRRASER